MNWDQNTRRRSRPASLWITGLSCALWALQATPVEPTAATGFRTAVPGYTYRFPLDHGSHDDFQTEWWYYTGHLRAADGRTFGYQLTFFRRAVAHEAASKNPSRWALRHLYFAHFAVTDEAGRQFQFTEKISRAGIHKAGAETGRLAVWIDEWRAKAPLSPLQVGRGSVLTAQPFPGQATRSRSPCSTAGNPPRAGEAIRHVGVSLCHPPTWPSRSFRRSRTRNS